MKKTEARRGAILAAAAEVFQESGYERCSMSDIGARTGFSKTTVYGYFASKETMLAALLEEAAERGVGAVQAALGAPAAQIDALLERVAGAYLSFALSASVCTLRRVLVATAGRIELDARWRDLGAARINGALAACLRAQMDAGRLLRGDAHGAALQFKALLEAPWFERVLFDQGAGPGPGQVEEDAHFAVATFLRAWAPSSDMRALSTNGAP
ncbi:TetR/AcrR family transcriptional regulator [Massilia suwonensis]|uniref:TetR/AcrR family transcriptional regulator n=1 Tax=Massilia suwonensis TaxID=648895 RepID=A0ABW0MLY4_9BURK